MKIASWNVNSLRVRLPHLVGWLQANPVDVIGLQELKLQDDQFPLTELEALGYHAAVNGQKTYNGVALLSRTEPDEVVRDLPNFTDDSRRLIAATVGGVRVISAYVPNGQAVGSDKYAYKLRWLEALAGHLRSELARYPKLAIVGDFNVAPTDADVHDPVAWEGQVLCSETVAGAARADGVAVQSLGRVALRNLREPLELFALGIASTDEADAIDPVCRMRVTRDRAAAHLELGGTEHWFCSRECLEAFLRGESHRERVGGWLPGQDSNLRPSG